MLSIELSVIMVVNTYVPGGNVKTEIITIFFLFRATSRILIHANTVVNVFIYAGSMKTFRKAFAHDLNKICNCCKKNPQNPDTQREISGSQSAGDSTCEIIL